MRQTAYGILIPFLGTSLGAACVFLIRRQLSDAVQRILTGFAKTVNALSGASVIRYSSFDIILFLLNSCFFPAVVFLDISHIS